MGGQLRPASIRIASQHQPPSKRGATKEHVRLARVIADKIEDGTLFRSGIYSNKDLARFVRNVADAAAPQFPTTQAQAQADSVQEDAARLDWLDKQIKAQDLYTGFGWRAEGSYEENMGLVGKVQAKKEKNDSTPSN